MIDSSIIYTAIAVVSYIISSIIFIRNKIIRDNLKMSDFYWSVIVGILFITFYGLSTGGGGTKEEIGAIIITIGLLTPLLISFSMGKNNRFLNLTGLPYSYNEFYLDDGTEIKGLTIEYLRIKKMKLGDLEYNKWLKKESATLYSHLLSKKECGVSIEQPAIEGLKLFENELNLESASALGNSSIKRQNLSEEFLQYKNIKQ